MNNFEANDAASQAQLAERQLAIVTRLWRDVPTMHHIDEVFQWVGAQLVRRFHVQVAEIWGLQLDYTEQYSLQLRTLISADQSLPEHVVANHHIAEFVTRQFGAQRSYPLQPVTMLFSGYPASTLIRYGLNYVTSYYFHGPVTLLPPDLNAPPEMNRLVPFTVAVLLFQHEKRLGDLLSVLQFIMPQVVLAAKNHGLLPDAQATPPPQASNGPVSQQRSQLVSNGPASQPGSQLDFWQLIPRRHGEDELLMSSNPFARSVDLPDKQARRLYGAIDGKRSIGEITRATKMDPQEAVDALRKLLVQRRVELYEPGGKLVNPSHFLA